MFSTLSPLKISVSDRRLQGSPKGILKSTTETPVLFSLYPPTN